MKIKSKSREVIMQIKTQKQVMVLQNKAQKVADKLNVFKSYWTLIFQSQYTEFSPLG
jgi:hypothetical protein